MRWVICVIPTGTSDPLNVICKRESMNADPGWARSGSPEIPGACNSVCQQNGLEALRSWFVDDGVKKISRVNKRLQAATPWYGRDTVEPCAQQSAP